MKGVTKRPRKTRSFWDRKIRTEVIEIPSANVLSVEVGTNGECGGDYGHGSRTYIRIENLTSTCIQCKPLGKDGCDGVVIRLGGDTELYTMIKALKFAYKTLKRQRKQAKKNPKQHL